MGGELERTKAGLSGKLERLELAKSEGEAEMSARLAAVSTAKADGEARLKADAERLAAEGGATAADLCEKLRQLEERRQSEVGALTRKVDELKALQAAALAAGAAKGRQVCARKILTKSSLNTPCPRTPSRLPPSRGPPQTAPHPASLLTDPDGVEPEDAPHLHHLLAGRGPCVVASPPVGREHDARRGRGGDRRRVNP